jgi:alpha-tubulin suppressor-like RCC1 family protein
VGKRAVVAVSARDDSTCAVFDDFTLKCWGLNASGELGLGDTQPRGDVVRPVDLPFVDLGAGRNLAAVAMGNAQTCAVLDVGTLKCWGNNDGGSLGIGDTDNRGDDPGEMGDPLPAVLLR